MKFQLFFILLSVQIVLINAHGRLMVPPARSSAWRENRTLFPTYYDDNEMSCGGYTRHWIFNAGRCGICGERADLRKRFEKGGEYYKGVNVRNYKSGELINVIVEITANHLGYFEFRLCNVDNLIGDATKECLSKTLLKDNYGNTRRKIISSDYGLKYYLIKLPDGLTCAHCVFQWKYVTGNSVTLDGSQEEFYGCSDIAIYKN